MPARADPHPSSAPTDVVLDRLRRLDPAQRAAFEALRRSGRVRGHECVARALKAHGVTHVYAMPGVPTDETIGACAREGMIATGVRHQQAAVMMAAAHNYMEGRLVGVALVSSGVAVANAITGACVAQQNGWPVLLLAGAVERAARGTGAFTELDGAAALGPLVKACMRVGAARDIERTLGDAMHLAAAGRPGVVYVELPEDCLATSVVAAPVLAAVPVPDEPLPVDVSAVIGRIADMLQSACRPLLLFGTGVRWDDAHCVLAELVEHLALPFVASPMGRGLLPDDHPLCCNADPSRVLAAADLVLVVGTRLDWTFRYGSEIRPDACIVHIPGAGEALQDAPPRALTVTARVAAVLPALLDCLRTYEHERAGVPRCRSADWPPGAPETRSTRPPARRRPTPDQLAAALARVLPPDAIVVLDGNVTLLAAQKHIPARSPLSRLTPGASGCMGTGLPFAIAAARACAQRPVILVTGDMALSLNFFEFETAVRHGVPVVAVLANNDGPSGARRQRKAFPAGHGEKVLVYQDGLRYDRMASELGVDAVRVDALADLPAALQRALAARRPALIQMQVDQLED